jgi:hypothetical protein
LVALLWSLYVFGCKTTLEFWYHHTSTGIASECGHLFENWCHWCNHNMGGGIARNLTENLCIGCVPSMNSTKQR